MRRTLLAVLVALLSACPARKAHDPSFVAEAISATGSRELEVSSSGQTIERGSRFEIRLAGLHEIRVRLFDPDGKIVSSAERSSSHGDSTLYQLTPAQELRAGTHKLIIDDPEEGEIAPRTFVVDVR